MYDIAGFICDNWVKTFISVWKESKDHMNSKLEFSFKVF